MGGKAEGWKKGQKSDIQKSRSNHRKEKSVSFPYCTDQIQYTAINNAIPAIFSPEDSVFQIHLLSFEDKNCQIFWHSGKITAAGK